jgi:cysteine desulfurase/selenocysteine lyase
MEHHSNIVPWQMLCERKKASLKVIPLREDYSLDIEAFSQLLSRRTKLVAVAHISNVLGIRNPIEEIIRLAHAQNTPVLIDGAQSAAHLPIDVQQLDCDFFACSAHKIYGPTGIGVLYGKEHWLNLLPPAEGGGEMIEHVTFDHTTYNVLPYKFEAGTPDFIGSYAFAKALQFISNIGMDAIEEHERKLTEYAQSKLAEIPTIRIYADSLQKYGVISFNAYTSSGQLIHPFDLATLLDRQGVAVRTGHHCAEPLIEHLGVPGTVRISMALYNNEQDIDIFMAALRKALTMLDV